MYSQGGAGPRWILRLVENVKLSDLYQCELCGESRPLVESHAIPRAALKKTKCNGQNITFENGQLKNHQSDGVASLLCNVCDNAFLGARFDKRGIECLVNASGRFMKGKSVADLMAGWVLSILWRAHHLQTPEYFDFVLPDDIERQLKTNLLDQNECPNSYLNWSKLAVISIYRLVDKHNKIQDHALFAAFPSSFSIQTKQGQVTCSMFRMLGFEFRVLHQRRRQYGPKGCDREVLKSGKSVFLKDCHFMGNEAYAKMMSQFFA